MSDTSSNRHLKRKSPDALPSQHLPKSSKVIMLNPSVLLLEIPADTNTSLPVWDAIRSEQVDISWTVNPYEISVHFTPVPSKQAGTSLQSTSINSQIPGSSSSIPQPHMIIQSIANTSLLMFTMSQNGNKPLPSISGEPQVMAQSQTPTTSFIVSLPFIISQSQVPAQPKTDILPITQAPTSGPTKLQDPRSAHQYHTRASSHVSICNNFLLNMCRAGKRCKMHHTPFPFHWQFRSVSDFKWVDIPHQSQILLEKVYCNVYQEDVNIKYGAARYYMDFDTMELHAVSTYNGIRRLATTGDPLKSPHFATILKVYWWNNFCWEEYHEEVQKLLREKIGKESECSLYIGKQEYKVDFMTMTQTNVSSGYTRAIRWRPLFRSLDSMEPHLKTGVQIESTQPIGEPPASNFSIDPFEEFSSWYPPVWLMPSEEDYSLVEVPAGTRVYCSVRDLFHATLCESITDIISIHQVQNLLHWDKYQRYKTYMEKQHTQSTEPLERHLFHGTTMEAAEDICHNNFDPRMAGANGSAYGYGSYFSTTAYISNRYSTKRGCGTSCMFLAKVLVGKVCLGQDKYHRPPPLAGNAQQYRLYDSCVNNLCNPAIFVVFQSCQCYPYYLIRYKGVPNQITI
ncbi:protein mono-ADP-ribosyltransferase TIPARP-like [Thalassophryne amazonica]|uniref:protein mono-ADP-ribosyltransferase TIPARP-like n=1 Tax=Thalassophryne amazonica TaxID=390379 RepID=UPI0014716BBB|nr:protein mono-ADP-ribosyltransferase TIPARP-like [Thalassophryne amazonica]